MGINDILVAFVVFCVGLCTYGMILLLRAGVAWSERWQRKRANTPHPTGESRRRLIAASILGVLATLLGGGLAAFVTPTFAPDRSLGGYRMAIAMALLGVGVACVIVGARWDRARGRRRCPTCWYNYDGLTAQATCPECGRVPETERRLQRTRRKPLLYAALPLMIAAAWIAYISPVAVTWRSYIPTTVMIAGYRWMPETVIVNRGFGYVDTLEDRITELQLRGLQRRWVASRARNAIMTRKEPEHVADACRVLVALANAGMTLDGLDEAGMRALHMLSDCKPHGGNLPSDDLFIFAVRYARSETPIDGADLDNVMRWTERTKLNLDGRNTILMRLAPRRADVIEAIEAEMNAIDGFGSTANIQASLVLGDLIRNDPELCSRIESTFRSSQHTRRVNYGRVVLSTRLARADMGASARDISRVADRNALIVSETLTSGDADLAEMAIMFPWDQLGFHIDRVEIARQVSELAAANPSWRGMAISYLCSAHALRERDIPALIAHLDENPESAYLIASTIRLMPLSSAWLELREPLRATSNRRGSLRWSGRQDPVDALLAVLDQMSADQKAQEAATAP